MTDTMTPKHTATPERPGDPRRPMVGAVVGLTVLLSVVLVAFAWPAARSRPHDVTLSVAGPPVAISELAARFDTEQPGVFDLVAVDDAAAVETAVRQQDSAGGIVLGPEGWIVVASGASPPIAQALRQVAAESAAAGQPLPVQDVAPLPSDDPRGSGFAALIFPLVIGGIATAGALSRLRVGWAARLGAALAVSALGGLALTAIAHGWLGVLLGPFWVLAGVVALGLAAMASALTGLEAALGTAGLGLGAATVVLLGNPLSGAATGPDLLPAGWAEVGQLLPPGATAALVRSVAWFDGAAATGPIVVLLCWLAGGVLIGLVGLRRRRRTPG